MPNPSTPEGWANRINKILATVLGEDRFPVKVAEVATEISRSLFSDEPITRIKGDRLSSIEGALVRAPTGRRGWGILFNERIESSGRINFTLAHEFGHYLLHRMSYPDGFQCASEDMVRWGTEYGQVEQEANLFASYLLMPLDDFRRQIRPSTVPDMEALASCADRYEVSLTAAALKWLSYTRRRSVLVVSRDGYILWARSSQAAFRSGVYFKTVGQSPRPIPFESLAASGRGTGTATAMSEFQEGVWFEEEPCTEMALFSDRYDFTISLLHLGDTPPRYDSEDEDEGLKELGWLDWT